MIDVATACGICGAGIRVTFGKEEDGCADGGRAWLVEPVELIGDRLIWMFSQTSYRCGAFGFYSSRRGLSFILGDFLTAISTSNIADEG